jgi:hypothetical protein
MSWILSDRTGIQKRERPRAFQGTLNLLVVPIPAGQNDVIRYERSALHYRMAWISGAALLLTVTVAALAGIRDRARR